LLKAASVSTCWYGNRENSRYSDSVPATTKCFRARHGWRALHAALRRHPSCSVRLVYHIPDSIQGAAGPHLPANCASPPGLLSTAWRGGGGRALLLRAFVSPWWFENSLFVAPWGASEGRETSLGADGVPVMAFVSTRGFGNPCCFLAAFGERHSRLVLIGAVSVAGLRPNALFS